MHTKTCSKRLYGCIICNKKILHTCCVGQCIKLMLNYDLYIMKNLFHVDKSTVQ